MEDLKQLKKVSYSQLHTYSSCHFKWYVHYHEKNYLYGDSVATEFGTSIHEAEEAIATMLQKKLAVDYVGIKNSFILKCHKIAQKYHDNFFSCDKSGLTYQQKMYKYLESAIYRLENFMLEHPELELIGIEQKFEFNYDDVHMFSGAIDRAFRNTQTGELLIQDIKSWSRPKANSELKAPEQFTIYTMAASNLWNVPIANIKCEYDLPLCNITQKCLSDNVVADGTPMLDKWFAGIAKNNFKPTISALCWYCNYNPIANPTLLETKPGAICPYFSTWQKSGDKVRDTIIQWQGLDYVEVDRQLLVSQLKQNKSIV